MTSAFGETLRSITTTKLREISKKRQTFEVNKSSILSSIASQSDQHEKLHLLLDGLKKSFTVKTISRKRSRIHDNSELDAAGNDQGLVTTLTNIERFLEQAQYDPTISYKLLVDWEDSLLKRLNTQSLKYEFATLYGELVNDWINSEQGTKEATSMDIDGFEVIDKADKQEARQEWEKAVFETFETDQAAIKSYLRALFSTSESIKALTELRKSVESFEVELSAPDQFNEHVLKWAINGLLNSGLLSEEKNQVLKDFLGSSIILGEVADVLNMRIASIENWDWEQEYVPVEQRRHLNGNYHIYIDEDLIEAIFLQYIGVRWSVFFKQVFKDFSNFEGAWASLRKRISKDEIKRRQELLGPQHKKPSVQSERQGIYKSFFFMSQLPNSPYEELNFAAGEEEANYDDYPRKRGRAKQTARQSGLDRDRDDNPQFRPITQQQSMMPQQGQQRFAQRRQMQNMAMQNMATQQVNVVPSSGEYSMPVQRYVPPHPQARMNPQQMFIGSGYSSDEYYTENNSEFKPKSLMETKQFLLHLVSTEILINRKLHQDFTVVHSSFDSWSPTLPHSTIRAVLSFYGLSPKWLSFFNTFLEAPLRFTSDGPDAPTRTRKRGVPGAHSLSSICGEAVLFVLDYAVNQKTSGTLLHRMHDDFWLWSPNHETVVKGWEAIANFASIMGVSLNGGKTGSVRIRPDEGMPVELHQSLPVGDIRWGFLILDSISGRFIIDQTLVDKHIIDLENQLKDKKSVFSYIQAWNTYAGTFFLSNFGSSSNSFGRAHVDSILSTLRKIQTSLPGGQNIAVRIRAMIYEKFGVADLPDGYLYFPTSLGGLGLQNPFVGLVQIRNSVTKNPTTLLEDFLEDEKEAYTKAKKAWENGTVNRVVYNANTYAYSSSSQTATHFMSFEEFTKYREDFSATWEGNLYSIYEELLRKPKVVPVDMNGWVADGETVQEVVRGADELNSEYLLWVGMLYGREMVERFGGVRIVEKGLLPTGMVDLFRSGRIRWQG